MSSTASTATGSKFAPAAPTPPKKLSTFMNFATAGMGGVMGWCVVHPFNTVAVQMSLKTMSASATVAGAAPAKALSFPKFFMHMVKEQGVMSLYNGLSAGILRQVFYATSRFGLFEVMRDE
mgnify:CR=1 FL=1